MFCTACGAKVNEGQAFCANCGARLPSPPPAPSAPVTSAPKPSAPATKQSTNLALILGLGLGAVILCSLLGIAAAVVIPNFITATQKAKVKATQKDMNTIAIALADYVTDKAKTPVQNGSFEGNSEFLRTLIPFYAKEIQVKDQWRNNFLVYCGEACNGQYGLSGCKEDEFLVVSLGRDGLRENWDYDPKNPSAEFYSSSRLKDLDNDLINYNGSWIRAPQR